MDKWIFLTFSLILSFTVFQDHKVSAVPSPQPLTLVEVQPTASVVNCAKQFGGFWDIPEGTIACKDGQEQKYLCNQGSCFLGLNPPPSFEKYDFWNIFELKGCYTYYGREFVNGVITPIGIKWDPNVKPLIVRGFVKVAPGEWQRGAINDLFICPIPDGQTRSSIMPSCAQCQPTTWDA